MKDMMIGYSQDEVDAIHYVLAIMHQKRYILKSDCDWSRLNTLNRHLKHMNTLYEKAVDSRRIPNEEDSLGFGDYNY